MIGIGCNVKTVDEWIETYQEEGRIAGYTYKQVEEYFNYIKLFRDSLK